ncbi:MAG: gliding motility-associated C-terminal domain-containing protein [Bacteroidota bacterium]|nr:gliding motility-associated C-terminal domain-containing protein [Bacteroidota bacterium]
MKRLYLLFGILVFFLAGTCNNVFAQLCQGSLGAPVVNITFGSGANPGPPIAASLTNYLYVPYSCPADGAYTIGNSSPACFNDTWHTLIEDHTPNDTSGYMMIVNASFSPGDFYIQQVDGLCDNTTYEFAAWILNILKSSSCGNSGILPNVTFNIETLGGTVLQTYKTGDIATSASPVWKQYGLFFKTPANVNTVVIRMTNNAPGGCGNDLVVDDITFRPCGALVTVAINNSSTAVNICQGDNTSYTFSSMVTPAGVNTRFQWQLSTDMGVTWSDIAGAINATYTRMPVSRLGTYQYRVAVTQGNYVLVPACSRVMSTPLTINQVPLPVPGAANDGPVCEGSTLTLKANAASAYSWSGPLNFTSTQQLPSIANAALGFNGKFYLKVTSSDGCVNTDSTVVNIIKGPFVDAGADVNVCEGVSTQLNGATNANSYLWQPPVSLSNTQILDPTASPSETTLYILTVDNGTCKKSDSVLVTVNKKPVANAGPDKVIIAGNMTTLNGTSNITDATVLWTPAYNISSVTDLTPQVNPQVAITYALTLSSSYGCGVSTDSVVVKVYAKLFIPNAFTPNNDGVNDVWNIEALEAYPGAVIKVFNRFGQMVFTNDGAVKSWDGKYKGIIQQGGAYPYIINLKNGAPVVKGVVYLIQ